MLHLLQFTLAIFRTCDVDIHTQLFGISDHLVTYWRPSAVKKIAAHAPPLK